MRGNKEPLFDRLVHLQEWLRDGEVKRLRSLETPSFEVRALFEIPGRARPVAVAARGIAGIAARAILVPVMLASVSNIAAAASDLVLGKGVRHVRHRRCRHSHAAAQRGDDTDGESESSDFHGSLL